MCVLRMYVCVCVRLRACVLVCVLVARVLVGVRVRARACERLVLFNYVVDVTSTPGNDGKRWDYLSPRWTLPKEPEASIEGGV